MTSNTFQHAPQNMPNFMTPAAKTWVASLLDLIFGDTKPYEAQEPQQESPMPQPRPEPMPPINSDSSEAFRNALMDATTKFANRHVGMLNQINPRNVFSVREVNIEFTGAPDQFVADITDWPADVRNECIKLIMEAAPGAKELITLQDYFGSTIVTDIKLVKGKVVQPLVSYSGSRFEIKFAFDGSVTQRPAPAPQVAIVPAPVVQPVPHALAPAAATLQPESFTALDDDLDDSKCTRLRTLGHDFEIDDSGETPLAGPDHGHSFSPPPIATLRLRSLDSEVTVPLMKADFPYTIGRHETFKGYSVQGHSASALTLLQDVEPAGFSSFVSRGHIVLDSYDEFNKQFRVITSKGKNGSFFKAATMPTHFLLPLAAMATGEFIKLGGTSGDGILELRIEAP